MLLPPHSLHRLRWRPCSQRGPGGLGASSAHPTQGRRSVGRTRQAFADGEAVPVRWCRRVLGQRSVRHRLNLGPRLLVGSPFAHWREPRHRIAKRLPASAGWQPHLAATAIAGCGHDCAREDDVVRRWSLIAEIEAGRGYSCHPLYRPGKAVAPHSLVRDETFLGWASPSPHPLTRTWRVCRWDAPMGQCGHSLWQLWQRNPTNDAVPGIGRFPRPYCESASSIGST